MAVYDERYGIKKPEKRLDPQKFSILRKTEDTEPIRRNAAPVAVTGGSSARTRAARSSSEPVHAAFTMDTWDASVRAEKERARKRAAEAEQRESNIAAQRERDRIAHENARARDAEMLKQREQMQDIAKTMLQQAVEQNLVQASILSAMEGMSANEQEVTEVGKRLTAQGEAALKVPSLWSYTLNEIRQGK